MILSHRHKFIFVKTRKTAGTSIEIALSKICGNGDIITPTHKADEKLRQECEGRAPQNFWIPFRQYTKKDWYVYLQHGIRARYREHMTAEDVIARVGQELWNEYYTFTVERNVYDKAVSLYYWRTRGMTERPDWGSFFRDKNLSIGLSNYPIYGSDFGVLVDSIMRFECLGDEMNILEQRFSCPGKLELPSAKSGIRKDMRSPGEVLDRTSIALISELCGREKALMKYKLV